MVSIHRRSWDVGPTTVTGPARWKCRRRPPRAAFCLGGLLRPETAPDVGVDGLGGDLAGVAVFERLKLIRVQQLVEPRPRHIEHDHGAGRLDDERAFPIGLT